MARGPVERAEGNVPEPDLDDDEGFSILLESENTEGDNPREAGSDKSVHYPEALEHSLTQGNKPSPLDPHIPSPPSSNHPHDEEEDSDSNDNSNEDNMSSSSTSLSDVARIKPLEGRDNWVEWDEQLQAQLGMLDLYATLTDLNQEPDKSDQKPHKKWEEHQRRLKGLLLAITGPHPKSLLLNGQNLTAVGQYTLLKTEYDTQTITTFSQLFRKI